MTMVVNRTLKIPSNSTTARASGATGVTSPNPIVSSVTKLK